jgi:hypothetical protein
MDEYGILYLYLKIYGSVNFLGQTIGLPQTEATYLVKINSDGQPIKIKKDKRIISNNFSVFTKNHILLYRQAGYPNDTINNFILRESAAQILKIDTSGKLVNVFTPGTMQTFEKYPIFSNKKNVFISGTYALDFLQIDTSLIRVPPIDPNNPEAKPFKPLKVFVPVVFDEDAAPPDPPLTNDLFESSFNSFSKLSSSPLLILYLENISGNPCDALHIGHLNAEYGFVFHLVSKTLNKHFL